MLRCHYWGKSKNVWLDGGSLSIEGNRRLQWVNLVVNGRIFRWWPDSISKAWRVWQKINKWWIEMKAQRRYTCRVEHCPCPFGISLALGSMLPAVAWMFATSAWICFITFAASCRFWESSISRVVLGHEFTAVFLFVTHLGGPVTELVKRGD